MGIFDTDNLFGSVGEDQVTQDSLIEAMCVMDLQKLDSETLQEFCESPEADALVEARVLSRPTLIRLSKTDDEKRRVRMCELDMCKKENKALWAKLKKNRVEEKKLLAKVHAQFGARAQREAKIAQREYIKRKRGVKLPKNFGGAER